MPPALPPWPAPDAAAAAPAPTTRAPAAPPSRAGPPPRRAPAPPPSTWPPHGAGPEPLRHPRRDLPTGPQPAVRRRPRQPEPQLVEQLRLQDRRSRPVAPSQVAERVRTAGVVPRQQLLDPPHPERGRRGHLGHLVALRQQPDRLDVPGRAGVRRDAEPLPQLRHAQVSRHLRHVSASRKPRPSLPAASPRRNRHRTHQPETVSWPGTRWGVSHRYTGAAGRRTAGSGSGPGWSRDAGRRSAVAGGRAGREQRPGGTGSATPASTRPGSTGVRRARLVISELRAMLADARRPFWRRWVGI